MFDKQYTYTLVGGLRKHVLSMCGLPTKMRSVVNVAYNKACSAHFVSHLGYTGPSGSHS